jgi:urease accessory protein
MPPAKRISKVERLDPKPLVLSPAPDPAAWGPAAPPPTDAGWLCGLMQAGDSFYPTGSYAHSFGLEGLVHEGVIRDRETLRAFLLHSAMPALRQVELPLAAHAWREFAIPNWDRIGELCVLSSALKTAREARLASENIGRQRSELAAAIRNSELAREFLRRASDASWPVVASVAAALEGRVIGAPLVGVLAGIYYTTVASLLSSAMKILRLGQNTAQTLMTETLAAAPDVIEIASSLPIDQIGWFNPWLEIAAARHETADARMFIS